MGMGKSQSGDCSYIWEGGIAVWRLLLHLGWGNRDCKPLLRELGNKKSPLVLKGAFGIHPLFLFYRGHGEFVKEKQVEKMAKKGMV